MDCDIGRFRNFPVQRPASAASRSVPSAASASRFQLSNSRTNARLWSGCLPPAVSMGPLSPKVFVAPVPWYQSEQEILSDFAQFDPRYVQWRHGSSEAARDRIRNRDRPNFCYLVFRTGRAVADLLALCRNGRYGKFDVISWYTGNSLYVAPLPATAVSDARDFSRTVFVGGLHGLVTAAGLAAAFCDLFGQVTHACLDTDRYMYPTGSGQVTFAKREAYKLAVECHFVRLHTDKFSKTIQIEPFLVASPCILCRSVGPLFCREGSCFAYFCRMCWPKWHSIMDLTNHAPITRRDCSQANV